MTATARRDNIPRFGGLGVFMATPTSTLLRGPPTQPAALRISGAVGARLGLPQQGACQRRNVNASHAENELSRDSGDSERLRAADRRLLLTPIKGLNHSPNMP
jgi:hypothetical protein